MPIIKHITITSCHCYGYGDQFCDWWIQLSYSMSPMSLAYLSVWLHCPKWSSLWTNHIWGNCKGYDYRLNWTPLGSLTTIIYITSRSDFTKPETFLWQRYCRHECLTVKGVTLAFRGDLSNLETWSIASGLSFNNSLCMCYFQPITCKLKIVITLRL